MSTRLAYPVRGLGQVADYLNRYGLIRLSICNDSLMKRSRVGAGHRRRATRGPSQGCSCTPDYLTA
jgi:hypothetical protein